MKTNKHELTSCHGLSRLLVTSLSVVVNYRFREIQHGLRMIHYSFRTSTCSLRILNMETFDCIGYRFCLERRTVANNGTGENISFCWLLIYTDLVTKSEVFVIHAYTRPCSWIHSQQSFFSPNRISFISTRLTMTTIVWDYLRNIYTKIMRFPQL